MKSILLLILILGCQILHAEISYKDSKSFSTENSDLYNFSSKNKGLQNYKIIDLSTLADVGSNCGQIDVSANLRSNLNQFMSGDFFKGLGNQIMDAGGLLSLCYLSQSACSITKNTRLTSGLTSSLDLSACSMIEKYQDQQIAAYEQERSQCVRSELKRNGNNVNQALKACGKNNYEYNLSDWGGSGKNVSINKLIESTAKWAGLKGAKKIIEVTKSFVGDTVIGQGEVKVEFGARKRIVSPSEMIADEKKLVAERLNELFESYENQWSIKDEEIERIFSGKIPLYLSKQMVQKLSYLPHKQRRMAIDKLSQVIAGQHVVGQVEKSMEILLLANRNPNLPEDQKLEAKRLREQLKDSLDLGVSIKDRQDAKLERIVASIIGEGEKYENWENLNNVSSEKANFDGSSLKKEFLDCSNKIFCKDGI